MDAQSEQIIKDIQDKRDKLGENIAELEVKVRDATNWRTYFHRNPWMLMGAAAAGGFILSAILVPSRRQY